MKLKSLLKDVEVKELYNFKNINVTNLSIKADELTKNGLFFAIKGNNFDGRMFIGQAINCGAKVVVTEEFVSNIDVVQVVVEDIRKTLSIISRTFFNRADMKLKIIGLIGTNGKTTTSTILYNIFKDSGISVGLIGTNGVFINDLALPNLFTTPDPIELFYTLEQMVLFNVKYVFIEISAHAIYYNKVFGICPDALIFTNITYEHLDFFETMERYSETKLNYIKNCKNSLKIINIDDEYGKKLFKEIENENSTIYANNSNLTQKDVSNCQKVITYGIKDPADVFAIDIKQTLKSSNFICNCEDEILEIETALTGEYNIYNVLAAISTAKHFGIENNVIKSSLKNLGKIDGRWEIISFPNNNKVIIDYAHTPDGFEKVFSTVKKFRKGRVLTLFGCVGYSDKNKRRMMGDIAKKYSDFVVVTSDNYSDSNFEEIFEDIGITEFYAKIENREDAVKFAISLMEKDDTLLLLGKGAENYQKTMEGDITYNEVVYVKEILDCVNKNKL